MARYLAYEEEIMDKTLWAVSFEDDKNGDLRAGEYLDTAGLFEWLANHMKPGDSFIWEKAEEPGKVCSSCGKEQPSVDRRICIYCGASMEGE